MLRRKLPRRKRFSYLVPGNLSRPATRGSLFLEHNFRGETSILSKRLSKPNFSISNNFRNLSNESNLSTNSIGNSNNLSHALGNQKRSCLTSVSQITFDEAPPEYGYKHKRLRSGTIAHPTEPNLTIRVIVKQVSLSKAAREPASRDAAERVRQEARMLKLARWGIDPRVDGGYEPSARTASYKEVGKHIPQMLGLIEDEDDDTLSFVQNECSTTLAAILKDVYAKKNPNPSSATTMDYQLEWLDILIDTAKTVRHLHRRGIVHRDIKIDNVFIDIDHQSGRKRAILGDFDSAICVDLNYVRMVMEYLYSDEQKEDLKMATEMDITNSSMYADHEISDAYLEPYKSPDTTRKSEPSKSSVTDVTELTSALPLPFKHSIKDDSSSESVYMRRQRGQVANQEGGTRGYVAPELIVRTRKARGENIASYVYNRNKYRDATGGASNSSSFRGGGFGGGGGTGGAFGGGGGGISDFTSDVGFGGLGFETKDRVSISRSASSNVGSVVGVGDEEKLVSRSTNMVRAGLASLGFTPASDVYSFAMLTYGLLEGREPYHHLDLAPGVPGSLTNREMNDLIIEQGLRPVFSNETGSHSRGNTEIEKAIKEVQTLTERMWQADPGDRPCIEEIVETLEEIRNELKPNLKFQKHPSRSIFEPHLSVDSWTNQGQLRFQEDMLYSFSSGEFPTIVAVFDGHNGSAVSEFCVHYMREEARSGRAIYEILYGPEEGGNYYGHVYHELENHKLSEQEEGKGIDTVGEFCFSHLGGTGMSTPESMKRAKKGIMINTDENGGITNHSSNSATLLRIGIDGKSTDVDPQEGDLNPEQGSMRIARTRSDKVSTKLMNPAYRLLAQLSGVIEEESRRSRVFAVKSGATATLAVICEQNIHVAWLGDSEGIYCVSEDKNSERGKKLLEGAEKTPVRIAVETESNLVDKIDGKESAIFTRRNRDGEEIVSTIKDLTDPCHRPSVKNEQERIESGGLGKIARATQMMDDGNEYPFGPERVYKYDTTVDQTELAAESVLGGLIGGLTSPNGGRITRNQKSDDNLIGGLAITRSLGDTHMRPVVSGDPSCTTVSREGTSSKLIIASDGLWDVVTHDVACVNAETSEQLVNLALVKGTQDNTTAIVVKMW